MGQSILIADDDEISLRLLTAVLRAEGYGVEAVSDGAAAWAALERADSPELVIADWNMPGCNGLELCRRVRERTSAAYTYLLLLSARRERDDVAQGLAAGADDYIIKPFYGPELVERVRSGVRILDLQRKLRAAEESLREQATRDALTGLWNRRAILDLFACERARALRSGTPLGVALVDIDHFKVVNDTHGHACGDAVLQSVSRTMTSALRAHDHCGRYGGEEFLVLLPECARLEAPIVAERLRAAVVAQPILTPRGASLTVSVSVGVTVLADCAESDIATLLASTDEALYCAKRAGRNRVVAAAALDVTSGSIARPEISRATVDSNH